MNIQIIKVKDLTTTTTKALLFIVLLVTVVAILAFKWFWDNFPLPDNEVLRIKYMEHYISLAQIIGVGVTVTLISAVIPFMLPEARDRFERYKESRKAYSRAKTAVLYLPDKVLNVDRKNAFLLVAKAHRELHLAETFKDVIISKGYLKWFNNPDLWIMYNYWQIVAVAKVLRTIDWNVPENKNLLRARLNMVLDEVHQTFGKRGENCTGTKWLKSRSKEEDDLEDRIDEILEIRRILNCRR